MATNVKKLEDKELQKLQKDITKEMASREEKKDNALSQNAKDPEFKKLLKKAQGLWDNLSDDIIIPAMVKIPATIYVRLEDYALEDDHASATEVFEDDDGILDGIYSVDEYVTQSVLNRMQNAHTKIEDMFIELKELDQEATDEFGCVSVLDHLQGAPLTWQ